MGFTKAKGAAEFSIILENVYDISVDVECKNPKYPCANSKEIKALWKISNPER